MTIILDGTTLPEQPVTTRWQIRPIGKTGAGRVVFPSVAVVQMVFTLAPIASGSITQIMSAWDNKPHTFVLPHHVSRVDTVYSGTYVRDVQFSVSNKSNNTRASVVVLLNVRFND